jgi:hypothetical protein
VNRIRYALATAAACGALLTLSPGLAADGFQVVEVTVTNITSGQIISPPVVASHRASFVLFHLGQPASPELAGVAEDGANGALVTALQADPRVLDVAVGTGPIPPGRSSTIRVRIRGGFDYVSAVGMLVVTNDTFFSVRGEAPRHGVRLFKSPGYDAGSEENNELCAFIPGPPCGSGGVRTSSAEGFVHINAGIHGIGDLAPADFDWRNPVATVTMRRVQ